jgi:hypothetical protein
MADGLEGRGEHLVKKRVGRSMMMVTVGVALTWVLLTASASAANRELKGELLGCKYKLTVEAAEKAKSGSYKALVEKCSSGEVAFTLAGTFQEEAVSLGEVSATAKVGGHEIPIQETLTLKLDVGFDLAKAIETAGETSKELKLHKEEGEQAAKQLLGTTEKYLIEKAAGWIVAELTGIEPQKTLEGLSEGEQGYCAAYEGIKTDPPKVCLPHVCSPEVCPSVTPVDASGGEEADSEGDEPGAERLAQCPVLNALQDDVDFVCVPTFVRGDMDTGGEPLVLLPGGALIVLPKSVSHLSEATTISSLDSIASFGGLVIGDSVTFKAPNLAFAAGDVETIGTLRLDGSEKVSIGSVDLDDIAASVPGEVGGYLEELKGWTGSLDEATKEGPTEFSLPGSGQVSLPALVQGGEIEVSGGEFDLGSDSRLDTSGLGTLGQLLGQKESPGKSSEFFGGSHGGYGGAPGENFSTERYGLWHTLTGRGATFDSPFAPQQDGDGGAGESEGHDQGTPGGGIVEIDTTGSEDGGQGSARIDGTIDVAGFEESKEQGGGAGAGGTVVLETGALSGGGTIDADGGDNPGEGEEPSNAGTGGGGRIAALYEADSGWSGRMEARGGYDKNFKGLSTDGSTDEGSGTGGAGTIFTQQVGFDSAGEAVEGKGAFPKGTLTIDGGHGAGFYPPPDGTPLEAAWNSPERRLVLKGEARAYAHEVEFGEIDLSEGSVLTTPPSDPPEASAQKLNVKASTLKVDASSRVTVAGRGYRGGLQSAKAEFGPGGTDPEAGVLAATRQFGGSHGGVGGSDALSEGPQQEGAKAGSAYDSAEDPTLPGGGGGADIEPGGADGSPGGGVLDLQVSGTLQLEGALSADGQSTAGPTASDPTPFDRSVAGAGAGGSVVVQAGVLSGAGTISAAGGSSCPQLPTLLAGGNEPCVAGLGGAGGGGRIAVRAVAACGWSGSLDVAGGADEDPALPAGERVTTHGGAGSVFYPSPTGACPSEAQSPPPTTKSETPKLEGPPIVITAKSAGKLSAAAIQKLSAGLSASFSCQVSICKVTLSATIAIGKQKILVRSALTTIKEGKKVKIALKLSAKDHRLIAAALAKHKRIVATLSATIESTIGKQVVKALKVGLRH